MAFRTEARGSRDSVPVSPETVSAAVLDRLERFVGEVNTVTFGLDGECVPTRPGAHFVDRRERALSGSVKLS